MCQNPSVLSMAGSDKHAFAQWAAVQTPSSQLALITPPHRSSRLFGDFLTPFTTRHPLSGCPKAQLPCQLMLISLDQVAMFTDCADDPQPRGRCSAPGCWTRAISLSSTVHLQAAPTSVFQTSLHTSSEVFFFFFNYTFYL